MGFNYEADMIALTSERRRWMDKDTLDILQGWAFFVAVIVSLGFFLKMIISFLLGEVKLGFQSIFWLLLWIVFTLLLVFTVILSGIDHSSSGNSGMNAYIAVLVHTLAGGVSLYLLFRQKMQK